VGQSIFAERRRRAVPAQVIETRRSSVEPRQSRMRGRHCLVAASDPAARLKSAVTRGLSIGQNKVGAMHRPPRSWTHDRARAAADSQPRSHKRYNEDDGPRTRVFVPGHEQRRLQ
jgi:hypothetical protein